MGGTGVARSKKNRQFVECTGHNSARKTFASAFRYVLSRGWRRTANVRSVQISVYKPDKSPFRQRTGVYASRVVHVRPRHESSAWPRHFPSLSPNRYLVPWIFIAQHAIYDTTLTQDLS